MKNKTMQDYATSIMADNYVKTKIAFLGMFKRKCMRIYDVDYVSTKTRYNKESITISFFNGAEMICEVEVNKSRYKKLK